MEHDRGPASRDLIGTVLDGRYRLESHIGRGAMGDVFRASHETIGRQLAVKVLRPERARSPRKRQRFLFEARAASAVNHENIVDTIDCGELPGGGVYMVMELLDGEDLDALLRREGRLPWRRAAAMAVQMCRGLSAAHAADIAHRDVKESTVPGSGHHDETKDGAPGPANLGLTGDGAIVGTATYMSPEQARSDRVDHRADIYSVGVILYQMLTGSVPFDRGSYVATLTAHIVDAVPEFASFAPAPDLPHELEEIVRKALEKSPEDRFQSCEAFAGALIALDDALPDFVTGEVSRTRPAAATLDEVRLPAWTARFRAPAIAILVGTVVLGGLGILSLRQTSDDTAAAGTESVTPSMSSVEPVDETEPASDKDPDPAAAPNAAPASAPEPSAPAPPEAPADETPTGVADPADPDHADAEAPPARKGARAGASRGPSKLTASALRRQLGNLSRSAKCPGWGAQLGTKYKLSVAVDPTGRARARVIGGASNGTVRCLVERVEKHRFQRSEDGVRLSYTFVDQ
jgi:serine/threonine-protein kinase